MSGRGPVPGGSRSDKLAGVENRGGARIGSLGRALPGPCFGGVCPRRTPGRAPAAAAGGHGTGMRRAEATRTHRISALSVLVALGSAVMMTARPWPLSNLTLREPGPRLSEMFDGASAALPRPVQMGS